MRRSTKEQLQQVLFKVGDLEAFAERVRNLPFKTVLAMTEKAGKTVLPRLGESSYVIPDADDKVPELAQLKKLVTQQVEAFCLKKTADVARTADILWQQTRHEMEGLKHASTEKKENDDEMAAVIGDKASMEEQTKAAIREKAALDTELAAAKVEKVSLALRLKRAEEQLQTARSSWF